MTNISIRKISHVIENTIVTQHNTTISQLLFIAIFVGSFVSMLTSWWFWVVSSGLWMGLASSMF